MCYQVCRKDQYLVHSCSSNMYDNLPDVALLSLLTTRTINQKHGGWCLPTARPRPHFNQWCDLWQMDLNQFKCELLSITRNISPLHFPYQLERPWGFSYWTSEMELPSVGSLFEGQKDAWLSPEISFRHSWPVSSQVTLPVTSSQKPRISLAGVGSSSC